MGALPCSCQLGLERCPHCTESLLCVFGEKALRGASFYLFTVISQMHDCLLHLISQPGEDILTDNVKFRLSSQPRSIQHRTKSVSSPLCSIYLSQHPSPAGKEQILRKLRIYSMFLSTFPM
uniref:Nuclear receptor corepressor 1 n=1 Tax=Ovis aries TaxID=9940 RepID=A0AC11D5F5_SHEEP